MKNDSKKMDLVPLLEYVDPQSCSYTEWCQIGMALKHEGYNVDVWDSWSRMDSRYHDRECEKKWNSFDEKAGSIITGATITQMAKDNGWQSMALQRESHELDWNDDIQFDVNDYKIVDRNWIEKAEIKEPDNWQPEKELITYLETLFDSTDNVGYVVKTWKKEGEEKYYPKKGQIDRTAGELIEELNQCGGDIGQVLGDYNETAGAWIRFNPLDGKGVKNDNVTDFKYALVESDELDLESQYAIIKELELPVACLVHSGKKSLHAIVKVDAESYDEYRKRVDFLYDVCNKNGLKIDTQNRNPSRLSRMPGIMRNGKKQYLIDTNIGKANWDQWNDWIEDINDDLPEPESLASVFDNLPELAPPLIHGLLRQGHKMLLAGPSKAGKSYSLIELCIAIAEGRKWLQHWDCAQGNVMYVNLELDRASCLHRFKDVYTALNYEPKSIKNIDIWNLRGKAVPMDKLAPKLIRRASKKQYIAIIIDPIYKIITGDENSADQMAHFTNQFDKVCTELGSAVIYCHHHSKGAQGGKKSMDRASGSGVFARDPDALIDMTELELNEDIIEQQQNSRLAKLILANIDDEYADENISQDDMLNVNSITSHAKIALSNKDFKELNYKIEAEKSIIKQMTAWRIEGTLREFANFDPINLFFKYPIHTKDHDGVLKDLQPEDSAPAWQKAIKERKPKEEKTVERKLAVETAYEALNIDNQGIAVKDLAEYMGVTPRTTWKRINEHGGFKKIYDTSKEKKALFILEKPIQSEK